MKITFFTANMKGGGAERVMVNILNDIAIKKEDFEINLLLCNKEGIFIKKISPRVNIIDLNKKKARNSLFGVINYLKTYNPDYFISSLDYINIIASLAHKLSRSKSKLIFWEHGILSIHSKKTITRYLFLNKLIINYLYKKPSSIVVVSKGAKNDLINNYKITANKIKVIYNGVFNLSIEKLSLEHSVNYGNYITSVGRLSKEKNYINLLEGFKLVLNKIENKDLKLVIVGEGSERLKIESTIKKLKLSNNVYLTGFLGNPYPTIKNSKLFVLSSDWEGFGVVLIEALALKKQIVSTDCPSGPREILDNGKYGLLVPISNHQKLADGINSVLNKEIVFQSEELLNRAKYFNIDKASGQFINLIESNV